MILYNNLYFYEHVVSIMFKEATYKINRKLIIIFIYLAKFHKNSVSLV